MPKFPPCPAPPPDGVTLSPKHNEYIRAAYANGMGAGWIAKRMGLNYTSLVERSLARLDIHRRTHKQSQQERAARKSQLSLSNRRPDA